MYTAQFRCQPAGSTAGQTTYDTALSFLKHLNIQELQSLMDDNERLNKLVDDLEIVKNQEQEKDTLIASNKSLAEYNLSLEPRLLQLKEQLGETYEQAVKAQKDYEQDKLRFDSCATNTSLDTTLALLQMEAAKVDEESEQAAEHFLSQPTDTEPFLSDYTSLRTKTHLRKVKVEKLEEILREQARQKNAAPSTVHGKAGLPIHPYPGGTPLAPNNFWGVPHPMNTSFQMPNTHPYAPR